MQDDNDNTVHYSKKTGRPISAKQKAHLDRIRQKAFDKIAENRRLAEQAKAAGTDPVQQSEPVQQPEPESQQPEPTPETVKQTEPVETSEQVFNPAPPEQYNVESDYDYSGGYSAPRLYIDSSDSDSDDDAPIIVRKRTLRKLKKKARALPPTYPQPVVQHQAQQPFSNLVQASAREQISSRVNDAMLERAMKAMGYA